MVTKKAGTILINKERKQIGLVYRKKRKDYSFPKGHLEQNETLEECAVRETIEETGRNCVLLNNNPLGIIKYTTNTTEEVEVLMFLALDKGEYKGLSPDPEVCIWKNIEDVEKYLTYKNLKDFWKKIYKKVLDELNK